LHTSSDLCSQLKCFLQIDDLTGINQQLQLELHDAASTREQLKEELFSSVQRITVKDHETQQVVKVAENATVRCILVTLARASYSGFESTATHCPPHSVSFLALLYIATQSADISARLP
jgi:hypothetical protein